MVGTRRNGEIFLLLWRILQWKENRDAQTTTELVTMYQEYKVPDPPAPPTLQVYEAQNSELELK